MSLSRCAVSVRGLDCPNEVGPLRDALEGTPGVAQLGFDLIHGVMTVDYVREQIGPGELLRLVRERTGMQAAIVDRVDGPATPAECWWSRNGRTFSTLASGLALLAGSIAGWLAPGSNGSALARGCFALS